MHRLLVETALLGDDSPTLPKEAARHLKVLRPKVGEEIELFDGKGKWRVYSFTSGQESASPLKAVSSIFSTSTSHLHLAAFIGPEGDFTPDELAALMKIAVPTSFGPTILRAETAAIYAVSVLSAAVGSV